MDLFQKARVIELTTPLGGDMLLFRSMQVHEQLGRMFQFDLEMLSLNPEIRLEQMVGQTISVRLDLPDGDKRYFHGYVSRFSQSGTYQDYLCYRATVHPWLWFLTRSADCRIYQSMTVPAIIKQVFRDHGVSDFSESLSGSYRSWEYCVQYRETDFNFVSRLMEQEGIYYYFTHEKDRHTLVLSDSVSAHDHAPGYRQVPFFPRDEQKRRTRDHIYDWEVWQEAQSGAYVLRDFDFENPRANLQVKSLHQREHPKSNLEVFDYPGEYTKSADGDAYVRARLEELQACYEQVRGEANARGLAAGNLFTLTDYPRLDQNREYLITSATHQLSSNEYGTSGAEATEVYSCRFTAISSKQQFRSPRTTPRPVVQGPQTATVVGKAGEEIWTDKYGRVKVQFHWDRLGKRDENSSCWVRVAQLWAGKNWGAMHIPRIRQEVIVDFLEGDPDQPIITGRVYNADHMPPYALPANQTQSGIKSHSTKGGNPDNFNELRFEDKKGEEEIYLQGEKNWTILIKNDKAQNIGHDETLDVGNDRTKHVAKNQTETVGENKTISVGKVHSESIGESASINIGTNEDYTVGKDQNLSVGDNRNITVGKDHDENIGKDMNLNVSDNQKVSIGKNMNVSAGKKVVIEAGDELTLNCGSASIVLKKNGDITLSGGKINIKADGAIAIKGSKITQN